MILNVDLNEKELEFVDSLAAKIFDSHNCFKEKEFTGTKLMLKDTLTEMLKLEKYLYNARVKKSMVSVLKKAVIEQEKAFDRTLRSMCDKLNLGIYGFDCTFGVKVRLKERETSEEVILQITESDLKELK